MGDHGAGHGGRSRSAELVKTGRICEGIKEKRCGKPHFFSFSITKGSVSGTAGHRTTGQESVSPPSGEEGLRLCGNRPDSFRLIIGKKNREERIPVLHLAGKRDRVGEGGLHPEGIHLQRDPVHTHLERRDMPLRIEGGDDGDRRDRLIIKGCIGWKTGHAASFLYGTPCKKIIGTHVRFVNRTKYEITKRYFLKKPVDKSASGD